MIGFVYDDGGRADAGYRGKTGDCVIRATAIATGLEYEKLYKKFARLNKKRYGIATGRQGVAKKDYEPVLESLGFVKRSRQKGSKWETFTQAYQYYGDCIIVFPHHMAAIVDGNLRDTEDWRTYEWEGEIRERKAANIYQKI